MLSEGLLKMMIAQAIFSWKKSDLQPQAQQDSRNIQQDEWGHTRMEAGY